MIYLILIFTVLFFVLAWRRLDLTLMFLIAALPAYLIRFNILGLPATLLEAMIWLVFIVWFLKNYRRIIESLKLKIKHSFKIQNSKFKIIYRYPFDWELVLLLLIAFAAAGLAGFNASSLGIWKAYFFEPALLFIVALNIMKGEKGRNKILWALSISALIVSFLAVYQKITGQLIDNPLWAAAATRRVVSFFGYPNAIGLYLGPIVLVMMGWLGDTVKNFQLATRPNGHSSGRIFNFQTIFKFKIFKIFFICLVIMASILSIYFAKSKGALMGIAAGLIVFTFLVGKKIRWAVIIILILISVGVVSIKTVRHQALKYLTLNDFSGQVRRAQWRETLAMLKDDRLLTGAGLANYQTVIADYHAPGMFIKNFDDPSAQRKLVFNAAYRAAHWQPLEIYLYPHNVILNFWSELGLVGMLLFIWIIIKYFWLGIFNWQPVRTDIRPGGFSIFKQFSMNKFLNIGLIGAMTVIVIHGAVDVPYFKNDLAAMFWLLVAMMGLINLENNYEKIYN